MTAEPLPSVWLWLGQPADGPEQLLMALVDIGDDHYAYRPLMAADLLVAAEQSQLAHQAADSIGVTAVLRRYELVSLEPVDQHDVHDDQPTRVRDDRGAAVFDPIPWFVVVAIVVVFGLLGHWIESW